MANVTIKCNENNGFFVTEAGELVLIDGAEAAAQDIGSATKMRTGENIYDVGEGVNYMEYIFAPQQDYSRARKSIYDTIMANEDVISVERLSIDIKDRVFSYSARISTIHGIVTVTS